MINQFIAEYVDWEASYDRKNENLYMTPLGSLRHELNIPMSAYDRVPSVNLSNVIDLGLAHPRRDFSVFLKPNVPTIDQAILGFTIDNCLVVGLAIESYKKQEGAKKVAVKKLEKLVNEFDCILGLVATEQGPPRSMEQFRTLKGVGLPVYTWSKH